MRLLAKNKIISMPTQDQLDIHHDNTRRYLAFGWSIVISGMFCFILYKYGNILAVLTLIIGNIQGLMAGIFGTYFASNTGNKSTIPTVNQTADTVINQPSPASSDNNAEGQKA